MLTVAKRQESPPVNDQLWASRPALGYELIRVPPVLVAYSDHQRSKFVHPTRVSGLTSMIAVNWRTQSHVSRDVDTINRHTLRWSHSGPVDRRGRIHAQRLGDDSFKQLELIEVRHSELTFQSLGVHRRNFFVKTLTESGVAGDVVEGVA